MSEKNPTPNLKSPVMLNGCHWTLTWEIGVVLVSHDLIWIERMKILDHASSPTRLPSSAGVSGLYSWLAFSWYLVFGSEWPTSKGKPLVCQVPPTWPHLNVRNSTFVEIINWSECHVYVEWSECHVRVEWSGQIEMSVYYVRGICLMGSLLKCMGSCKWLNIQIPPIKQRTSIV